MPPVYDAIAEDYKKAKQHPWRTHIEEFTLFDLLGDLGGKSVLDLACGEGFYTRKLRQRGAARVVGVDVSPRMIELARAEEARNPLGIDYLVSDVTVLDAQEPFDLVVAAYLLNYARTPDQLLAMCRAVARNLKPGCRFVAVNNNLQQPPSSFASTRKYGLVKSIAGELCEGAPITFTLFEDGRSFSFDNYYLSPRTYEGALASAGLGEVRWQAPRLSPEGEAASGRGYWDEFLAHPPVMFLEARKRD
jgi:SAM-dependent methyltransferase